MTFVISQTLHCYVRPKAAEHSPQNSEAAAHHVGRRGVQEINVAAVGGESAFSLCLQLLHLPIESMNLVRAQVVGRHRCATERCYLVANG